MDQRFEAFAKVLVGFSNKVKPGDLVYIDSMEDTPTEMILAVMEEVELAGGFSFPVRRNERLSRKIRMEGDPQQLDFMAAQDISMIETCQSGIIFRGFNNIFSSSDVPADKAQLFAKHYAGPVTKKRSPLNWIFSRWPTPAMAQLMGMSVEQLEDLFFRSVLFDYAKMAAAAKPLQDLMEKTDQVHIKGPGKTDLTFSIKGIPVVPCVGELNIPDGEVFTAPVRDSVNGVIEYNTKTITHDGYVFERIRFEFENGKIMKATCKVGDQKMLDSILDTDEGARYIGEFALGFHPMIDDAVGEVLFDEKVRGSFHLTPGRAYDDADNGNTSNIHWDIVCIQRPEYGGGEIWFDGVLVRKDGMFVLPELKGLNPDNLLAA